MDNAIDLVAFLRDAGIIGLLTLVALGGQRGWYVWAREYKALERERDWWRGMATRALKIGETAISSEANASATTDQRLDLLQRQLERYEREAEGR